MLHTAPAHQLKAIHDRHANIRDEQIDRLLFQHFQRLHTVVGNQGPLDLYAILFTAGQHHAEPLCDPPLILNDQDVHPHHHPPKLSSANGIVKRASV